MTPARLLLAAFVLLGTGLQLGGLTMPFWVPLLFLIPAFACTIWAFAEARKTLSGPPMSERWLAGALCILTVATFKEYPGMYVREMSYNMLAVSWTAVFLGYAFFRLWGGDRYRKTAQWGFWIAVGMFVLLRAGMLFASPAPHIDVFSMIQQGSGNLLRGLDPFYYPVRDIYNGGMEWCYVMKAYSYPPANLVPHVLAFGITGDARAATVAADLLSALLLLSIGRRMLGRSRGELLALLFLAQPRSLYILEQAWTEPLLSTCFLFFVWLWSLGYKKTALAAYGYLLSLKQYLVFTALHILILERRWKRLSIIAVAGAITTLPFLPWHPPAVITEGFLMQLRTCFRPETPSLGAAFHALTGIVPPKMWTVIVGLGAAAFFPWWLRHLPPLRRHVFCALGTLFSMFLLGSQGMLNYYMLVATLMLAGIVVCSGEDQPSKSDL